MHGPKALSLTVVSTNHSLDKHLIIQTNILTYIQKTDFQTNIQTEKQTNRQTEKQTNRQTDKQ